jgi:putative protein-disulfide isomerase
MDGLHFIYIVDPMCSWCWGFSPVIGQLRQRYADVLPIRPVMGGLRPGVTEVMSDEHKTRTRGYWAQVQAATGQPFDEGVLETPGFIYDTDPPARAVVLARRMGDEIALDMLARLQRAFYAEGKDITKPEVQADIAAELGFDRDAFLAGLAEEALKQETWGDYAIAQRAGVTGFPTLIVGPNSDGTYAVAARGCQPAEGVVAGVDAWLARARPAAE